MSSSSGVADFIRNGGLPADGTSRLDSAIAAAFASVPECLVCGYVDLASGLLLGIKTAERLAPEAVDLLGAIISDMFQGDSVKTVETLVRRASFITDEEHLFNEIITLGPQQTHLRLRGKRHPEYVAFFHCRANVNLGMALTKARMAVAGIEEAI